MKKAWWIELEYCVPMTLRRLLDERSDGKKRYHHGLDLGCGTGLSGQAFIDMIDVLDGIDLSAKMIELAEAKKIYRHLYAGNIINFLQSSATELRFLSCCRCLCLCGRSRRNFFSVKRACPPGCAVLFFHRGMGAGTGYRLQPTGRFAHAPAYIHSWPVQTGWTVAMSPRTSLRKEKGSWVQGDLWFLRLQEGFL